MTSRFPRAVGAFIGRVYGGLDAIEHEGEILVVLSYYRDTTGRLEKPAFVIPLSSVAHQDLSKDPLAPVRWKLDAPLPEWILHLTELTPDSKQYGVREGPDTWLELAPTQ